MPRLVTFHSLNNFKIQRWKDVLARFLTTNIHFSVIAASIVVGCFIASSIFNIRILHVVVTKVKIPTKVTNLSEKKRHEDRHKSTDLTELVEHEIDSAKNDNNFKDISTISKITKDVSPVDTIPEMNVVAIEGKLTEKREPRWIINR